MSNEIKTYKTNKSQIDYIAFLKDAFNLTRRKDFKKCDAKIEDLRKLSFKKDDALGMLTVELACVYNYIAQNDLKSTNKHINNFDDLYNKIRYRFHRETIFAQILQRFYNIKSAYFRNVQALDMAILYSNKALTIAKEINDTRFIINVTVSLSNLYHYERQFDKAINILKQAFEKLKDLPEFKGKNVLHYCLADNQSSLGLHIDANNNFNKAIYWAVRENNINNIIAIICGQALNCLHSEELYPEAKSILDKASILIQEKDYKATDEILIEYYKVWSMYHVKEKQYQNALDILSPYLSIVEIPQLQQRIQIFKLITEAYIGLGEQEKAFEYLQKYTEFQDQEYQNARSIYFKRQEIYLDSLQDKVDDSQKDLEKEIAHRQQLERDKEEILKLTDLTMNQKEALEQKSEDLERMNQQLEHFSRMVAHDLKEPLRTMHSFAQILEQGEKNNLQESSLEFLNYIVEGSDRMQKLISSILEYSKLGNKQLVFKDVDVNMLIESTLADLRNQIQRTNAKIEVKAVPPVKGVPAMIKLLFQNLISNALKFIPDDRTPHIKIGAEIIDGKISYYVSDNGIGIAEENIGKVFEVFTRLNKKSAYEGSGLGLASCHRIIELHNGGIWLESEPDKGTTFYFTFQS